MNEDDDGQIIAGRCLNWISQDLGHSCEKKGQKIDMPRNWTWAIIQKS